jgi:hypothetical protein
MDPGEQGGVGLGLYIFKRERTPKLGEPHQHAAVPVLSATTEFHQPRLELGVRRIHQEPEHVEGLPEELATELSAYEQPHLHLGLHGQEIRNAAKRVMVREAEGGQTTFLSEQGQSPRRVGAVRMEGVAMEVDHRGDRFLLAR